MQREATGRDDEYGSGRDVREHGDGIDVGRNMRGQIGEGSGRSSHVGMEGVGFESYTIGAPPLRRLATNSHPIGVPIMGRSHLYGNIVPPRAQWSQPEAVPARSIGRMGHGMQSSEVMRRDQVEVLEREGTQRTVQLPRPSTVPTLFDPSPREYTEEDKDRLSRKMVGAAVDKAFTTTPFDGTNFQEWALRFGMNARMTNLWEFFVTRQYPVAMVNGEMRDAMERLEALQADYSQRATLAFWVLLHSVSATIQLQLDVFQESYSPAFEAWEYLMETYQAKDSVAKASLQRQLDNLKMESQERVEEYINRATAIRDKLAMAGKLVDEDSFTLNLITGLPPHWEELRHSAMLHDISDSYTLQRMMIQEECYQDFISKTNQELNEPVYVELADGSHLLSSMAGTIRATAPNGTTVRYTDVLYVPGLKSNLLSYCQLYKKGARIHTRGDGHTEITVADGNEHVLIGVGIIMHGVQMVQYEPALTSAHASDHDHPNEALNETDLGGLNVQSTHASITYRMAHKRLGHPSYTSMDATFRTGDVEGLFISDKTNPLKPPCDSCLRGKMSKAPFPTGGDKRTTRPLELVHSDIMDLGDAHPSLRYVLTLKDDYTNYLWVAPLARRSDMAAVFSAWHREMKTKLPTKPLAALRTDNGGEYTANAFTDYLTRFFDDLMLPDAESLLERQRYMDEVSPHISEWTSGGDGVGSAFDSFSVSHTSSPSSSDAGTAEQHGPKANDGAQEDSPAAREADTGEKTTISDLPAAGISVCEGADNNKLEDDASHLYDFAYPPEGIPLVAPDVPPRRVHFNPTVTVLGEGHGTNTMTGLDVLFGKRQAGQTVTRFPNMQQQNVLECAATGVPMVELTYKEPKTLQEMTKDPYAPLWQAAVDAELAKFDELDAYEVVDRADIPKGTPVLTEGVVLRVKRDEHGQPNRFKARWVVKGCGQTWRTYDGTYAPVSQGPTSRVFIAGASTTKRKVVQLDISNAFLYAPIDRDIFNFTLTVSKTMTQFLGLNVAADKDSISLGLTKYFSQALATFGMEDNRSGVRTPITKEPGPQGEPPDDIDGQLVLKQVGTLLYISTAGRPDITYAAHVLASQVSKPTATTVLGIHRVFNYLQNTTDLGLVYGGGDLVLRGYTDSDSANEAGRHSVGGYVFTLGGAAVSWRTKRQTVIATSTAEAEYVALFEGAREATYLRRLCKDLGFRQQEPTVIFVDNQSAIALATGEQMSQRIKHMDVRYHWTRKAIRDGVVRPEYCPTAQQAADYLTKPLTTKQHLTCSLLCGLQPLPHGAPSAPSTHIEAAGAALSRPAFSRSAGHQGIT
ncbi:unnamed protein product [Closterium sp. Yama58-4]|nr:unnamed protein product [Closterium sp. Yama58-4]